MVRQRWFMRNFELGEQLNLGSLNETTYMKYNILNNHSPQV